MFAAALATVIAVHPGMTLVQDSTSAMVIADLCAPGVAVRATRYSERQATPQQWGQSVGVQAAINADFFDFPGWTHVLVRARGAGEEWPASAELLEQPSGYWQFGDGIVGLQGNSLVAPPNDVTEVVGAYDPIIGFGGVVDQSGDPFMQEFHRRSGIGVSWDLATLYLYASNAVIDGPGMANEMMALAAEAGAPAIAFATNQDGGGSSQLYVDGYGQVIDSGRQVIDHLGIYASGSGAAPNCPNKAPKGYLDGVACDGFAGWAQDPDVPTQSIDVQFFFDDQGPIDVMADVTRQDLCGPLGSCNHAFTPPPPFGLLDGKPHKVQAYGVDSKSGNKTELAQSPQTMTCPTPPLTGVRRHVVDLQSFVAWKLLVLDVLAVDDATFGAIKKTGDLPATPELIRADDGSPEVWIVDGPAKRHVIDPTSAAAWRFDLGSTKVLPAAQVKAMPTGLPWPTRPRMVRGSGPEIDLLDTDPDMPEAGADGGATSPDGGAPTESSGGCSTADTRGDVWLYVLLAFAVLARRHSSGVVFVQRLKALAKARPSE